MSGREAQLGAVYLDIADDSQDTAETMAGHRETEPGYQNAEQGFGGSHFWQMVEIQVFGPYLAGLKQVYVAVALDSYSQFPEATTMEVISSTSITHFILNLFCRYGVMEKLALLQNQAVKNKDLNVKTDNLLQAGIAPTIVMQQVNSPDERWQHVEHALSEFVECHPNLWHHCLEAFMLPLRVTLPPQAEYSPHYLAHGREASVPAKLRGVWGTGAAFSNEVHLSSHQQRRTVSLVTAAYQPSAPLTSLPPTPARMEPYAFDLSEVKLEPETWLCEQDREGDLKSEKAGNNVQRAFSPPEKGKKRQLSSAARKDEEQRDCNSPTSVHEEEGADDFDVDTDVTDTESTLEDSEKLSVKFEDTAPGSNSLRTSPRRKRLGRERSETVTSAGARGSTGSRSSSRLHQSGLSSPSTPSVLHKATMEQEEGHGSEEKEHLPGRKKRGPPKKRAHQLGASRNPPTKRQKAVQDPVSKNIQNLQKVGVDLTIESRSQGEVVDPHDLNKTFEVASATSEADLTETEIDVKRTNPCPTATKIFTNVPTSTPKDMEKQMPKKKRRCKSADPSLCPDCGKTFSQVFVLTRHRRHFHGFQGGSKYKCVDCNYQTVNKGDFVAHVNHHAGLKPYKCDGCQRCFSNPRNLTRHTCRGVQQEHGAIFQEQALHVCKECGKSFATKQRLTFHAHTHASQPAYTCQKCHARFQHRQSKQKHEKYRCKAE